MDEFDKEAWDEYVSKDFDAKFDWRKVAAWRRGLAREMDRLAVPAANRTGHYPRAGKPASLSNAESAAAAVIALINSKLRSPTKEELVEALAPWIKGWSAPMVIDFSDHDAHDEALSKYIMAALTPKADGDFITLSDPRKMDDLV